MKSILTDKNVSEDIVKIEADVIVTATVLGFIGTRYHQNQPCSFDYEHPSPENFRIWEVLDSLSKSEEKDSNKAKQELMIKIQELWKSIQKTDKDFYDNHGLKDLEVPTEQVPKLRSQNQTLQDVQYNNYLAKRLILDLEKKYPTISSLLKSLDQAIEDYAEELDDYQKFLNVLDAMSIVLDQTDKKIGDHLDDSQSPAWVPGALITGLKGGAGVDFRDRHRQ
ncbi:MAG: hypothetical protein QNJ53_19475, partial [Pleurocapsa sp. MO_192.B19]|nr:hypothetical protein [Pleurocapsa sp. MO_192.B19]